MSRMANSAKHTTCHAVECCRSDERHLNNERRIMYEATSWPHPTYIDGTCMVQRSWLVRLVGLQGGMTWPEWVAPLERSLPQLASAVKYALAAAALLQEQCCPAEAPRGKAAGKGPAKKADPKVIILSATRHKCQRCSCIKSTPQPMLSLPCSYSIVADWCPAALSHLAGAATK